LSIWGFGGGYTSTPYQYNPKQNYDTGYGDFMLGLGTYLTTGGQVFPKKYIYLYNWETNLFVDDKIRLRPNLTVSIGLGYQYTSSFYEKQNFISRFDYGTGQLVWPQSVANLIKPYETYFHFPYRTNGPDAMFDMPRANFAPRIAVAYSPWGSKTVIRTGYALYDVPYSTANITPMANPFPFSLGGSQQTTDALFVSGAFNLALPAPNLSPNLANAFATPSLQLGDPGVRTPYVQMWNMNVQHELPGGAVLTVGYVGNSSKHLNMLIRRNAPPPGPGALNPRRPYPQFSRMINVTWQGISNYNALQANLTKRFNDGSQVIASYAFGKALGNTDELVAISTGGGLQVQNLLPLDYGRLSFDFRHIFRTGFVYALPVGRGKKLLTSANRVEESVLGGWQFSGIATLQSGQAFTIAGGAALNAERGSRPNRICDGNLPGDKRTVQKDFDTSCFVTQAPFTEGTAGYNILSQRPLHNLNLSISKAFALPITEATRMQFRAEMFNTTNTPALGVPNRGCCTSTAFGQISSTERDNRIFQMGLKVLF
jgi:hypothetical protein